MHMWCFVYTLKFSHHIQLLDFYYSENILRFLNARSQLQDSEFHGRFCFIFDRFIWYLIWFSQFPYEVFQWCVSIYFSEWQDVILRTNFKLVSIWAVEIMHLYIMCFWAQCLKSGHACALILISIIPLCIWLPFDPIFTIFLLIFIARGFI